jgi:polyisoprenoid-binding protein YceI
MGPDNARLIVYTGREGVASRAGHDLKITFGSWSGQVDTAGDDLTQATVRAVVQLASIEILEGTGGVAPLTGRDRREITKTALRLLGAEAHPEVVFESTGVAADARQSSGTLDGTLTVAGVTAPVSLRVTSTDGGWHATTTLLQRSFGIEPYRAFFGALRLADDVRVEVDVTPA